MTWHLCRDFISRVGINPRLSNLYLMSAFLLSVLDFTQYSHTNFNLTGSTYTINSSSGSLTTLTGSSTSSVLLVSPSHKTVSNSDINRFVALKSTTYPTFNSGLFRVVNVLTASNALVLDYRSSEQPITDTVFWTLYESETLIPTASFGGNSSTGYNTFGPLATATRIVLKSKDISSSYYYVRLAIESTPDLSGTVPAGFSISLGESPNQYGDFNSGTPHLHGASLFNSTSSMYRGSVIGFTPSTQFSGTYSFFALGDDIKGTSLFFNKNQTYTTGGNALFMFGFCDDETQNDITSYSLLQRMFLIGYGQAQGQLDFRTGLFTDGTLSGLNWSKLNGLNSCILSSYSDSINPPLHFRLSNFASSSFFGRINELLDLEVLAGTYDSFSDLSTGSVGYMNLSPYKLGRAPMIMMGQASASNWTVFPSYGNSTGSWLHTMNGVFIPWAGPLLSGTITTSSNPQIWPIYTQQSNYDGLAFYEPSPSGIEYYPSVTTVVTQSIEELSSFDANRYKKTYSYARQLGVNKGIRRA